MSISENIEKVKNKIESACLRSNRNPQDIQLVTVSKGQTPEDIKTAFNAGITVFGENKIQEAYEHMEALEDLPIKWHFIGKLQKNKINKILKDFAFIQSVDGVKNLEHIHKRVSEPREVFIEINIGEEKSKSGFTVEGLKKAINYIEALDKVIISGLMCIPPFFNDPEDTRQYFIEMRNLKNELNELKVSNIKIKELSMGMSNDYEVAIEEGATIIRLGTAIFGKRK